MTAEPLSYGYAAEPTEVAAVAAAEIGPILEGWPRDPGARAVALTSLLVTRQAVDNLIAAERARAVAEMHNGGKGMSYAQIAAVLGVSRARAQQLCEAGRQVAAPSAAELPVPPGWTAGQ